MDVTTIAVPATIVLVLSYVFQFAKPALEHVPGLRPGDATHDDGLRVIYGALSFALVLGYALYQEGTPATSVGWENLLVSVLATAVTMAVGGHYLYQRLKGSGPPSASAASDPAVPADYPPGAPSVAALGLPTSADGA